MKTALIALLLAADPGAAPTPKDLATLAEKSGFTKTGRYDEVIRLCSDFALQYPAKVRCLNFGGTPEGRPMLALVASDDGVLDAAAAKAVSRPVVLFQGGIHAGEIDGKDAGFLLLRELLEGKAAKGALSKVTAVFVPVFNVDGHERFGANNRPNQLGPQEMGWRVTAQNLNLNRDYAKTDAPEMAAMLRLLGDWDPIVYLDLHVTDGAEFQHDIAFLAEPTTHGPAALRKVTVEMRDAVGKKLTAMKHVPLTEFYPSFNDGDDPQSGVGTYAAPPRFSTAYWALHNRIGILVETHSWKDYATRVRATHDALVVTLELTAKNGPAWVKVAREADLETAAMGGKEIPFLFDSAGTSRIFDFKGYAYTRTDSGVSGGKRITYDKTKPQIWKIPFFDELKPVVTVTAPRGGYIVQAAHAGWVSKKLETHGIDFTVIRETRPSLSLEVFRAARAGFGKESFEGHQTLKAEGAWTSEMRAVPAGSLFVPIAQPGARLILHLFEPAGPDSFLAWGFFNAHFEQKEYMEAYVAETEARAMMAKDPALKAEFEKKVAADPEFAKDPAKRLDFFYRKHAAWDERMNLYPVYRVAEKP